MFVKLKMKVATIGTSVKARNPKTHGDRKMNPQRASRRAIVDPFREKRGTGNSVLVIHVLP
jgi:hypothetical protein